MTDRSTLSSKPFYRTTAFVAVVCAFTVLGTIFWGMWVYTQTDEEIQFCANAKEKYPVSAEAEESSKMLREFLVEFEKEQSAKSNQIEALHLKIFEAKVGYQERIQVASENLDDFELNIELRQTDRSALDRIAEYSEIDNVLSGHFIKSSDDLTKAHKNWIKFEKLHAYILVSRGEIGRGFLDLYRALRVVNGQMHGCRITLNIYNLDRARDELIRAIEQIMDNETISPKTLQQCLEQEYEALDLYKWFRRILDHEDSDFYRMTVDESEGRRGLFGWRTILPIELMNRYSEYTSEVILLCKKGRYGEARKLHHRFRPNKSWYQIRNRDGLAILSVVGPELVETWQSMEDSEKRMIELREKIQKKLEGPAQSEIQISNEKN